MGNALKIDSIRVVIFDCDGVMFDSRTANVAFYNKILNRFDMPLLTEEDTDVVHMYTGEDSVNYLFRNDSRLMEAQQYRKQVVYDEFIPLMVMEPHLEKVLASLHKRFSVAMATNRTSSIHTILDVFNLKQYFDFVVCSLDVDQPKPHPETALKILNHFNAEPHEAIYIGDTQVDENVAREAGIPFIAFKNESLDADYHLDDLREMVNLLLEK